MQKDSPDMHASQIMQSWQVLQNVVMMWTKRRDAQLGRLDRQYWLEHAAKRFQWRY